MNEITMRPIGVIHSNHHDAGHTPIQPYFADDCTGTAEIFGEYADGLADIEMYSHLYLLFHFNRAEGFRLRLKPYLEDVEHGVFATRSPFRPNGIGLSIVRLEGREGNVLRLGGVDILDGTPLLDIKPYTTMFDNVKTIRNGWHERVDPEELYRRGRRGCKPETDR